MPTSAERRALLFFATLTVLGAGWRSVRWGVGATAGGHQSALAAQLAAVDSARGASIARGPGRPASGMAPQRLAKPPAAKLPFSGPVDMDRASAEELERLPRIGPALANRIIADREVNGAFGSLEGLQRVKGIGPAMARELAPLVRFSLSGVAPPARSTSRGVVRTTREPERRGQIIWPAGPRGGGQPRPPSMGH